MAGMTFNGQCVFLLPVFERWLLVAPLQQTSALLNQRAAQYVMEDFPNAPQSLDGLKESLLAPGLPAPSVRQGAVDPYLLGLIPTRACNLGCGYCNFGASTAPGRQLDIETANQAIEWMAERCAANGRESLDIHYFGGEPFIATHFVDVTVHRAHAVAARYGLRPQLHASTNGVFSEAFARFIGQYFTAIVLSFDGPAEIQNLHRPGKKGASSFEAVVRTARILSDAPVELCLRVCVTTHNIGMLEEITTWFCRDFHAPILDFEPLTRSPESEQAGLFPPDPYDFAQAFEKASRIAANHGVRTNYVAASRDELRGSFCPVSKDSAILTPDGRVSACYLEEQDWRQRGLDLVVGAADRGGVRLDDLSVHRVRGLAQGKPRCEKCFCRWWCAGGCHVNQSYPGCSDDFDDFCIQTRLITAADILKELGAGELARKLLADPAARQALAQYTAPLVEVESLR